MAELYLLRHGQASFGAADYDVLSPKGEEQARVTGAACQDWGDLHHAWTGGMRRHTQTYEGFAEGFGEAPEACVDPGFAEYDHEHVFAVGLRDARPASPAEMDGLFRGAIARWVEGAHADEYEEPYAAFRERVLTSFDAARARVGSGQRGLIVTSGGPIGVVVQSLLEVPNAKVVDLFWNHLNTGLTQLRLRRDLVSLSSFNVHTHLPRELRTYR